MKINITMKIRTDSDLSMAQVLALLDPIKDECTKLEATMSDYSLPHMKAEYKAAAYRRAVKKE